MQDKLSKIIEGALMSYSKPLNINNIKSLFEKGAEPDAKQIKQAISQLQEYYTDRGVELVCVASGWRFQVPDELSVWIGRLWEEKPPRYSRALLETLALIAYRQPITRGEIEDVRGVAVSSNIIRTLLEREWVRVLGHKEVPGRPAMYGTTKIFLDDFNLKNLDELPSLMALKDLGYADTEEVPVDLPKISKTENNNNLSNLH